MNPRKNSLVQFCLFLLMGLIPSLVDLGVFSLANFMVFKRFSETSLEWRFISYPASSGGLCAFLAMALSYAVSQVVNFIVQRKVTFQADNNTGRSAVLYAILVALTFAYTLWFPSVISKPLFTLLGPDWGAISVKCACQFTIALIHFPLDKFVIMRSDRSS